MDDEIVPEPKTDDEINASLDNTEYLLRYILGSQLARFSAADKERISHAISFARDKHMGQIRASGEPYFRHPIETAKILAEYCPDTDSIIAALLHDVVEDCGCSPDDRKALVKEVVALFNPNVYHLVDGVTKISNLRFNSRIDEKMENLRKMIISMARDIRVIFIKLADRLHNMRTLGALPPEKRVRISGDTRLIYAPLANRLGMTKMKSELEDLAMLYLNPVEYRMISDKLKTTRERDEQVVELARRQLIEEMQRAGLDAEVKGRQKHIYSIYGKMQRRNLEFESIYDIIGVRVICDETKHCYDVLGIVHHIWHPIHGQFDDYISVPKENGYQSLHTTVHGPKGTRLEVQIRTREMNRFAEVGMAAHWKYKEGSNRYNEKLVDLVALIRETADNLQDVYNPSEYWEILSKEVFEDRVFVYTPKDDVYDLPAGATPLDLAYYIHSQIGNECCGAKVNGKQVPLATKLVNGDRVEIQRSKSTHPVRDWMQIAQTPRAWSKIRHYLRTSDFEDNYKRGRESLVRSLRARGIPNDWDTIEKHITPHLKVFRMAQFKDIIAEIGLGALSTQQVINRCWQDIPLKSTLKKTTRKSIPKIAPKGVLIGGLNNVEIHFAGCCTPLPGEDILGYVTVGRGVTVHTSDCPSLNKFRSRSLSGRILVASWDLMHPPIRTVQLRIDATDHKGLLTDLAGVVTGENISITGVNSSLIRGNTVHLTFTLAISSIEQLERLRTLLMQRKGVNSVYRVKKAQD